MSKLQKPYTKITATAHMSLCVKDEVIDQYKMTVSWTDGYEVSFYKPEAILKMCKQHLTTKTMRFYREQLERNPQLQEKIAGRKTKITASNITYTSDVEFKDMTIEDARALSAPAVGTMKSVIDEVSLVVKEFHEMKQFLKKHYGQTKETQRFLQKKEEVHGRIGKIHKTLNP